MDSVPCEEGALVVATYFPNNVFLVCIEWCSVSVVCSMEQNMWTTCVSSYWLADCVKLADSRHEEWIALVGCMTLTQEKCQYVPKIIG